MLSFKFGRYPTRLQNSDTHRMWSKS
jgi:hypothetical protein